MGLIDGDEVERISEPNFNLEENKLHGWVDGCFGWVDG